MNNDVPLSRRRLVQFGGVGLLGGATLTARGRAQTSPDRLEIVAAGGQVEYTFTATGPVELITNNSFTSAETAEETVTETDDGNWEVSGLVKDGQADAFTVEGDVVSLEPADGSYVLYRNGTRVSHDDLVVDVVQREHTYSFVGTGDSWADYYLEVEDGGDLAAVDWDGAVVEPDFHWISEDGTKAAGRVDPDERHTYAFDNLVQDVTIEGEADAYVDGEPSALDWYPRPGATGDDWKGGFPWQQTEEEEDDSDDSDTSVDREHTYSFVGTGDSWADYYLEVEDGGDLIATEQDGAVVEPDFHWISEDGTKAAGRVDPDERHTYAFDNLVQDVTIDGTADAYVDGEPSDLTWYPRPGATGDHWKGGFPWQDEAETTPSDGPVIGGGSGYANTVTQSQADVVVRTHSELSNALSSASSGDVIFVPGGESIALGSGGFHVPSGVTVASNRGVNGSSGAFLYTNQEADECFVLHGSARLTGVQLKGPHPGDDWSGSSYAGGVAIRGASEVDNCDVWGFSHHGVRPDRGDGAHVHHNVIRENNKSGLGYGVACASGKPVIEYNYFNFNRHSVTTGGDNPGYICRYNHFGPQEVLQNIDAHAPAGINYEIHNNVVETVRRAWDDNINHIIVIRDVPDDVASITGNWFFNPNAPDPDGPTDRAGQAIIQPNQSYWQNVSFSSNYYGTDVPVTYSDVIPGYDGWRSP